MNFDVGESYAGLLPISTYRNETRELYFWYFPSENEAAENEITIWLNGGPGCSSLEGLLQENGPFLWQYGTYKPVKNPYTWVNLTNMVWVEQPVGTGFSQGTPSATSETDVASQFLGFFKNFLDTFNLHHKKIYITGESYAGYYIPYIADAMLNTNDTKYYNVEAIMMYDPSTSTNQVQQESKPSKLSIKPQVAQSLNYFQSPGRRPRRRKPQPLLPQRLLPLHPPRPGRLLRLYLLPQHLPRLPPQRASPRPPRHRSRLRPMECGLRRRPRNKPLLRRLPDHRHLPHSLGRAGFPRFHTVLA